MNVSNGWKEQSSSGNTMHTSSLVSLDRRMNVVRRDIRRSIADCSEVVRSMVGRHLQSSGEDSAAFLHVWHTCDAAQGRPDRDLAVLSPNGVLGSNIQQNIVIRTLGGKRRKEEIVDLHLSMDVVTRSRSYSGDSGGLVEFCSKLVAAKSRSCSA